MSKINLNQSPYFDDYNENKKFYKILFRPGRAVQGRELTQMQTAIQKQIERMGRHIFEQGAQVLPGSKEGVKYINNNGFIKLPNSANAGSAAELEAYWLGRIITSTSGETGIKAKVIGYRVPDTINEARLFLTYIQSSDSGLEQKFLPGQSVQTDDIVPVSGTIPGTSYSVGTCASVIVEEGVYFFDGNFILVDQQTIFLTPTDTEAQDTWDLSVEANGLTTLAGLRITETIVTSDDDESLLENALGSPNYAAPGADRLHISADLVQVDINTQDSDFISLVRIRSGVVEARTIRTEYSVLEDTLARRTNDESGDYTVVPFQLHVKDFLRDGVNNGAHNETEFHYDTQAEAKTVSITKFGLADPGQAVLHPNFPGKWIPGTSYNTAGDATSFIQLCNDRLSLRIDPGKAYVKGYEIEKLSTATVDVLKARTLRFRNNKTIFTPLGTFLYVKNMFGAVTIENYDTVELHSKPIGTPGTSPGAKIGSARVLAVEFFSGVNGDPATGIYRLFLFNVQADAGKDLGQLKSIYSSSPTFTCDCVLENFRLTGSVASGTNKLVGSGTSWKNDELQRLKKGDYVQVSNGPSAAIYLVTDSPSDDNNLPVSPNPATDSHTWASGATIDYIFAAPQSNSKNAGLVYNLPDDVVYSVRGGEQGTVNPLSIDTVYTSRKVSANGVSAPLNQIQLPALPVDQEYDDFNPSSYVVIKLTGSGAGDWFELIPYVSGTPAAGKAEVQPLGSSCTIFLNASDAAGSTFYVIAPIIRSGGSASQERSKTLQKGSFTLGTYSAGAPFVISNGSEVSEISLGKADILRITRIVEGPEGYGTDPSDLEVLPADNKDITGLYILDDGQRDYFYDIGKVTLRPGAARPRGKVRVEFDYFEHGTTGNYFSVDSYPVKGPGKLMEYEDIPDFVASDGTRYDLASAIDFRPRVNVGGVDAGFATNLELPKDNFRCDYHFYEGRIDKLYLDKTGEFLIKSGTPDVKPAYPDEPDTGMVIYELDYAPYTTAPDSVFARMRDNKRYTMRDIGKLETRIKTLEYYTSLSLLESDTKDLSIQDAQGNDKFKNGFLVDNFGTFNGDLGSDDYRASIDRTAQTCRPLIYQDNVGLFEKYLLEPNLLNRDALRVSSKYQKTGDVFTLPYEPVKMLEQTKASKVANVNPYTVFTFIGALDINPWSDEWRTTQNMEPLNVQDQGQWAAASQPFGTLKNGQATTIDYSQTITQWTGVNTTTEPTGREILEIAGHSITDKMPKKDKKSAKKNKTVLVPEGYANAGAAVPLGRRTFVAPELRTTTTLTGADITTQFTSTFVDQGWSTPVSLGSRIVETALAEFIRVRYITFTAKGFMPGARLYAFFDDIDVNEDCAPGVSIAGSTDDNISVADKIAFNAAVGQPLICDSKGRLTGTFRISNKEGKRFKVGDRVFRLTTSPKNQKLPPAASSGESKYTARGFIDVKQDTTYSTRTYRIDRGANPPSSSDKTLTIGETLSAGKACPRDPIAQSFFVYENGGCFLTHVDVFFYKRPTGDVQSPITLQIRPLESGGNPSNIVLPFGEVIKEAIEVITNQIDLVSGTMTVTGYDNSDPQITATSENSGPWPKVSGGTITSGVPFALAANPAGDMIPTRFTFESPIYCAQGQSFCIVLIADSSDYNVWVAQSGPDVTSREGLDAFREQGDVNTEIGTNTPILKDPYIQGVFFKSQNGISWTADQTIDLKFAIYKADFDTSVNGEIEFVNEELPVYTLTLDPLETKSGSSLIRVMHPQHALTDGVPPSRVVLSPVYDKILSGTLSSAATTVTGVGTAFLTELVVGSFIQDPITREQKKVTAIASNTSLTIASAFTVALSSASGVLGTSYLVPSGVSLSGIDASAVFTSNGFDVELAEMDFYIIDIGVAATSSGRVGGSLINATQNKRFEELMLLTTPLALPETSITWNIQTTSSAGVNDSSSVAYNVMARRNLTPNEKIFFDQPMQVSSWINEKSPPSSVTPSILGDTKSLNIRAVLHSDNSNISPIIDQSRMSAFLVAHRLDNPRGVLDVGVDPSSVINSVFDEYQCLPTTVAPVLNPVPTNTFFFSDSSGALTGTVSATAGSKIVTGVGTKFLSEVRAGDIIKESNNAQERTVVSVQSDLQLTVDIAYGSSVIAGSTLHIDPPYLKIKTANASAAAHISKLDIGKYLTLSGATSGRNFSDVLVLDVVYTPNNTVVDSDLGAPKLAEIQVQYRTLTAAGLESLTTVTITQKDRFIDEIAPSGGSCSAKYVSKKLTLPRTSNSLKVLFDAHRHESVELDLYYKLEPVNSTKTIDEINWTKAEFNLDIGGTLEAATPDANDGVGQFSSYEATLNNLPGFVGAQGKIVMRGGNPARAPLLKNFRLIGLDE